MNLPPEMRPVGCLSEGGVCSLCERGVSEWVSVQEQGEL